MHPFLLHACFCFCIFKNSFSIWILTTNGTLTYIHILHLIFNGFKICWLIQLHFAENYMSLHEAWTTWVVQARIRIQCGESPPGTIIRHEEIGNRHRKKIFWRYRLDRARKADYFCSQPQNHQTWFCGRKGRFSVIGWHFRDVIASVALKSAYGEM